MEVSTNGSGPGGLNGSNGMSRAERFEDEKRRIMESCFAKKEPDGSLIESYITHIRIIEDSAYPSSPPPPQANPGAKKPRLIIVAVRKSGRVRMHKARENVNGTFSIGKTWMLDDLSSVQSFNGLVPQNKEEEQHKEWAQGIGFIVTIGKPYYWQANTQKEKQFFVASLVKIYTKYTGGKQPNLIGFDAKERDQLLGISTRSLPPSQNASPSVTTPSSNPVYGQRERPQRREPSREPPARDGLNGRDGVQRQMSPAGASSLNSQASGRPLQRPGRDASPSESITSNRTNTPQVGQPGLRRLAGTNQSQDSFTRSEDSTSLPPRSRGGLAGVPSAPGRFQDRSVTPTSQRAGTPDSSVSGNRDLSNDVPPVPAPLALPPERRRPPMPIVGDSRQRSSNSNDNMVPAPLASPGNRANPTMRREDLWPPARSNDRSSQPRERDIEVVTPLTPSKVFTSDIIPDTPKSAQTPQGIAPRSSEPIVDTPISSKAPSEPLEDSRPGLGPMIKQKPVLTTDSPVSPITSDVAMESESRPGLGPMIRNKKSKAELANTFLKAAKTSGNLPTFKPRAGGAAERLREAALKAAEKSPEGPDGITGVVPAPSLARKFSIDNPSANNTPAATPVEIPTLDKSETLPEVKVTVPQTERPLSAQGPDKLDVNVSEKSKVKEAKRPKLVSEIMQKELASIGVDPIVLGGRGGELVAAWEEFGWVGEGVHTKNIDQMKDEIDRELNRVQAGGWLTRLDEEDDRIAAVHSGLDKCINECDELDNLLTLYLVELSTRNADVAYIEAQSQGLQVQAANQKLLQAELKSLLGTISISSEQLGPLREASIDNTRGLEQIEKALVTLYKAMLSIDPTLSTSVPRASEDGGLSFGQAGSFSNELGSMRVMQEKKEVYRDESAQFLRRLKPFLNIKFPAALDETKKALEDEKGNTLTRSGKVKLDPRNHDLARDLLWKYSPLMLFTREADRPEWEGFMKTYEMFAMPLYRDEFREAVFAWQRIAKRPVGDEGDVLFTSQIEKQSDGIATTARKLTVKRSQTLAKSLRSPIGGDSSSKVSRDADGRLQPFEVFGGVLDEMVPLVSMEQNFIVDFFHITSLEQLDFPEAVAASAPDLRRGTDLRRHKVMDPNRELAAQVVLSMNEVFSFFEGDLKSLVGWGIKNDPLQGVGLLVAIERKLRDFEESSQEFLARTFTTLHGQLKGLFNKFLEEQIRAIEETKVKIKKRKGVIGFMKIFPSFSLTLETMLVSAETLEIRETVNNAYIRINKAMFESLKVIARENPGAQVAGADPEDKEALNYQILLIENMNHYLEEVDSRNNPALEEWKENAAQEMEEHMSLYLEAVIRRPLGKLLDFVESTESQLMSQQPGELASKIAQRPSNSKTTFKKVLAGYDAKYVRKGIEKLKERVEKHFAEADDQNLVAKVLQNCEGFYERVEDRILTISRDVYDGDIIADWTRADVSAAFKK